MGLIINVRGTSGSGKTELVRQIMADATGVPVGVPETSEPVLLGSAILGAVAGGRFPTVEAALAAMSRTAGVVEPAGGATATFPAAKRRAFLALRDADRAVRSAMVDATAC